MYTEKNFNEDLYLICTKQYVKFDLLKAFAYKRISEMEFVNKISSKKDEDEINQVLKEVYNLQQKVQQNGGRFDEDPILAAYDLRKAGKPKEALNIIVSYIKDNKSDEYAKLAFAWIMYDYLKATEQNFATYIKYFKKMNDFVQFDFRIKNESLEILLKSFLKSIREVVKQGELPANRIFEQFKRFVGNSPSFIEKRTLNVSTDNNYPSQSRLLIREMLNKLNDINYFSFIEMIGFNWFDDSDYLTSSFTKDGKIVEMRPLAETILNYHARKLINSDEKFATREKIMVFLPRLAIAINKYPEYEWLPYYRSKLLIKIGNNKQAFSELTEFARSKRRDFWVWDLLSELVDEDERLNCICAGLLCKTEPKKIVRLQEKSIKSLLKRELYAESKYILDKLIETRTNEGWKISDEIQCMTKDSWYINSKSIQNIYSLQPYADQAQKILYRSLPFTDTFITYINDEKGVINFQYILDNTIKRGYFYKNTIDKDFQLQLYSVIKIQMIADKKYENLFHVFLIEKGNEEFKSNFVKKFCGIFENVKEYGFIRDNIYEIFISSNLVKEKKILPFSMVSGSLIKNWNNKKNSWTWEVISIDRVEKPRLSDYEKEISGRIEITMNGFGFVDECYVPEVIIKSRGIEQYDYIKAKAQKSWDKSKCIWSWKVSEIISNSKEKS